jgi:membrane protease YdiL (CAAX protease family)
LIVGLVVLLCLTPLAWAQTGSDPIPDPVIPAGEAPAPTPGEVFLTSWMTWLCLILSTASLVFLWKVRAIRPGVLKAGERRADPVPAHLWFIAAIVSYLALLIGGQSIALFLPRSTDLKSTPVQAVVGFTGFLIAATVSILLARMLHRAAPDSGLTAHPRRFALGLMCLFLAMPLVYLAGSVSELIYWLTTSSRIVDPIAHPTLQSIVDQPTSPWAWVLVFTAVVLAPIHEELVYRGFIQTAALRAGAPAWLSILLTSALFALVHRSSDVPWYAIGTLFMLSLCLGFAYERSRSIAVPIAMHMGFNALNVVIAVMVSQ